MHSLKRIPKKLEKSLKQIVDIIQEMCTHCSECCKSESFFLIDVEAPIIASHLYKIGGIQLVKKHIRKNPTVFNSYQRYHFNFEDECPFHLNNRCRIYSDRPLVCQLFPMVFLGLFDSLDVELREPAFAIDRSEGNYDCQPTILRIEEIRNNLADYDEYLLHQLYGLIASSLLDEKGLAFCFGQPRERGRHFVDVDEVDLRSWIIVEGYLLQRFIQEFGVIPDNLVTYCETLSDEDVQKLASEKAAKKATTKTAKRLRHLEKHSPEVIRWSEEFSK